MVKNLGIIKKVLFGLSFLLLILPWFRWTISDTDGSIGLTYSGFETIGGDIVPFLLLLVVFLKRGDKEKKDKMFFYLSIGGVLITLIIGFVFPAINTAKHHDGLIENVSWRVGIWLSLINYVALTVFSYIDIKHEDFSLKEGDDKTSIFKDKMSCFMDGAKKKKDNRDESIQRNSIQNESNDAKITVDNNATTDDRMEGNEDSHIEFGGVPPERLFCVYCGTKLKKGALFCTKCGKKAGE